MDRKILTRTLAVSLAITLTGCGAPAPSSSVDPSINSPSPHETMPPHSAPPIPSPTATPAAPPSASESLPPISPAPNEQDSLDETQKNSIAMLNYLAVLSQQINSSQNSRLFLEEAYAALINNTNPERVNELTESHLSSLLDIIEKYRMISVKRDRLQYIYQQNKAKALKEAMPNPIGLLSAVSSLDIKRLVASTIYMAVDSYSSYKAYNSDIAQDFLQDGWELDDEEAANLHDSRKRAFMFMIDIVREDDLPGELALNESAVEEFVSWKNNSNTYQKILFFESEEPTYHAFGNYWLELADCYYSQEDYKNCLKAMDTYENLQADIFRKDYYLAQALPKAIVAAREVYDTDNYIPIAERYLDLLLKNAESDDWALKYFAAEIYIDLYAKTQNSTYLSNAYQIALNNVNNLIETQHALNVTYLSDVQDVKIPEYAERSEKKQIKQYNKSLHQARKVELAPVYEPLILNCDLLFALAEQCNIGPDEREKIEGILRGNGTVLFLSDTLESLYSFNSPAPVYNVKFDKDQIVLSGSCVSEQSVINVTVTDTEDKLYNDWIVDNVDRPTDEYGDFIVTFTSESAKEHHFNEGTQVKVEIFTDDSMTYKTEFHFKVKDFKNRWLIPDSIEFEQVN